MHHFPCNLSMFANTPAFAYIPKIAGTHNKLLKRLHLRKIKTIILNIDHFMLCTSLWNTELIIKTPVDLFAHDWQPARHKTLAILNGSSNRASLNVTALRRLLSSKQHHSSQQNSLQVRETDEVSTKCHTHTHIWMYIYTSHN